MLSCVTFILHVFANVRSGSRNILCKRISNETTDNANTQFTQLLNDIDSKLQNERTFK